MTDKAVSPSTQAAFPSQTALAAQADPVVKNEPILDPTVEQPAEEEPYTIKCICNFSDDDGNTIYCDTCDTWQHIDCFYPNNREEAVREDFSHSCAECKPRPLDRQKAIERTIQLRKARDTLTVRPEALDKKPKRPLSKSTKKRPKPNELHTNGHGESGKVGSPPLPSSKKAKTSHRPSHSTSSQPSKRSPSYSNQPRANAARPPSPATTPPDLPDDFQIHHYSAGFYSLYSDQDVPDTHNNAFTSLAIPTALTTWLRDPDTMKQEVGRTRAEVFQEGAPDVDQKKPKLEVKDTTRSTEAGATLRWRYVKSTAAIEKDVPLIELHGEIGFQKDYCADAENLWADLSSPLPFVFFHPVLPLYIDTRKEGSLARYIRRSCKPNAQLDTYLSEGSEYHFWLVSDRFISANEQITLPWDFRLEKSVRDRWLHLLGLSDEDSPETAVAEPELDQAEYLAISNWIDRILSEYGGCACDLENNCAFARFHRQHLRKGQAHSGRKKSRKIRNQTISPTSTGHATNSRAASEGHADDALDDFKLANGSRSKPPSRDPTPMQGSFDQLGILTEPTDRDKRKVAMVEDSFRRMEQQPPPRKKKRISDGTGSMTSKSKSRNGSTGPPSQYVDAGTSRSKSGSPASAHSPSMGHPKTNGTHDSMTFRSRQTSMAPRSSYCDASIQTEPVEGEWFSTASPENPPKKRIILLARRLMNSRRRYCLHEEERRKSQPPNRQVHGSPTATLSPTSDHKFSIVSSGSEDHPPIPQTADANTVDAVQVSPTIDRTSERGGKTKTPDLRVQLPPVPAFDNTGLNGTTHATPLSAPGSAALSPSSSPFSSAGMNGIIVNPSPIKKKLSLSDYKSRLNKAGGKMGGGPNFMKPSPTSPRDVRVEIPMESQTLDQADTPITVATDHHSTNGM